MKMPRENYRMPLEEANKLQKLHECLGRVSVSRPRGQTTAIIRASKEDIVYLKLCGFEIIPIPKARRAD